MLIRVSVENYKSFDEKAELAMVSSSKARSKSEHVTEIKGAKLLRFAAIYGANAAGKSNLIDAIRFVQTSLRDGLPLGCREQYCRTSSNNHDRESNFELQFSVEDAVFAYGFSAILSQRRIAEEWLYQLGAKSSKCLLLRTTGIKPRIDSSMTMSKSDRARFNTYAEDFAGNDSQLFLGELNRSKQFDETSKLYTFKKVYEWLTSKLVVMAPMEPSPDMGYLFDGSALDRVSTLLRSFDTGISRVSARRVRPEELAKRVPEALLKSMLAQVQLALDRDKAAHVNAAIRGDEGLFALDFLPDGSYAATEIQLMHEGSRSIFSYSEESDGTKRLLDIINVLLSTSSDVTFVMDELERSLHPMLVRRFLMLFEKKAPGSRLQLVFSTHESSVMDQKLFRRDEIWFVNRSQSGSSKVYSLDRFRERFDKDIAKAYLEGRYGAVPVFLDLLSETIDDGTKNAADS